MSAGAHIIRYARRGFRILPDDELTDGLRAIRIAEAVTGFDMIKRCLMRKDVKR